MIYSLLPEIAATICAEIRYIIDVYMYIYVILFM